MAFIKINFILCLLQQILANLSVRYNSNSLIGNNTIRLDSEINDYKKLPVANTGEVYYSLVNIGSNSKSMRLVIDSQNSYIAAISEECTICKGSKFDIKDSKSFMEKDPSFSLQIYNHELLGKLGTDKIEIANIALNDSRVMIINNVTHIDELRIDGYIGMGFTKNKENNILYQMKKNGYINDAIFSILPLAMDEQSFLYLGGYDKSIINETIKPIDYINITYTDDEKDDFTERYISSPSLKINEEVIDRVSKIVINSASNILRIPKDVYFQYSDLFFKKESGCQMGKNSVFRCQCANFTKNFPNITFFLDKERSKSISIIPEDYTMIDTNQESSSSCILSISLNWNNEYWILGSNFMRAYYTIFEITNERVGFYEIRNETFSFKGDILIISLVILIGSVVFFSVLFCIYKKVTSNNSRPREQYDQIRN